MTATDFLEFLLPTIGSLLVALLGWATAWLRSRTRNEHTRTAIDLAHKVTEDVVLELQHTVVERLQTGGRWDAAAKAEVKARAVEAAMAHLGAANLQRLDEALSGGAKEWLATRVEATVARARRGE